MECNGMEHLNNRQKANRKRTQLSGQQTRVLTTRWASWLASIKWHNPNQIAMPKRGPLQYIIHDDGSES